MSSRRVLKAAQAIREVVSMAILTDLKDPRVEDVTVTFVEVSADLRYAKIHVSIMGDDKKQRLCLQGLKHAAGYLQQKVGKRIDTRYTPRVQFVLDRGVENARVVAEILNEVLPKPRPEREPEHSAAENSGDPDSPPTEDNGPPDPNAETTLGPSTDSP